MFIKCGFTLVVLFVFLCECNSQLNVDIINGELYDILKYDAINNEFNIKKNQFNYSINDGFIIDFGKMKVPTQFSFSYLIDNYNESQYFEGCDIRLTSITKDELKNNNYKTGIENDVIFFRIRHPDKINFNDLPIYIDHNNSNFNNSNVLQKSLIKNFPIFQGCIEYVGSKPSGKSKINYKLYQQNVLNCINDKTYEAILANNKKNLSFEKITLHSKFETRLKYIFKLLLLKNDLN